MFLNIFWTLAVQKGLRRIVEIMLINTIDPYVEDKDGERILYIALKWNHRWAVKEIRAKIKCHRTKTGKDQPLLIWVSL